MAATSMKGTRTRWQTPEYDDEALLLDLRLKHRHLSWSELTVLFNNFVPEHRKRTADAISNKGPLLMKAHRNQQAFEASKAEIQPAEAYTGWDMVSLLLS